MTGNIYILIELYRVRNCFGLLGFKDSPTNLLLDTGHSRGFHGNPKEKAAPAARPIEGRRSNSHYPTVMRNQAKAYRIGRRTTGLGSMS